MPGKEITGDPNSTSCVEERREAKSPARAARDFDKIRDSFFIATGLSLLAFLRAVLCRVMNQSFPTRIHFLKRLRGQRIFQTEQMLDAEAQIRGSAVVGGHAAAH